MKNKQQYSRIGSSLAALTFTLLSCSTEFFVKPAEAQFSGISEKEEIRAGQQVRQQAIKEYGQPLSSNDPRQQRVTRLGRLFSNNAKRKNIPYSYTVLNNDKVLNAFAAPGGPIFVTTKLVSTAANDAELAYVLGHETGHIEEKHIVNAVKKQQQIGLAAGILGAILGRGGSGDWTGAVISMGATVLDKGYSRDNERDADNFGVEAMAKLGFDPRAAVSMLGKLGGNSSGLSKYLSTHPSPESRQKLVTELIQKKNLTQVATKAGGPFLTYGTRRADSSLDENNYMATPVALTNHPHNSRAAQSDLGLRIQPYDGYRVIMAPVSALTNFAGGKVERNNNGRIVTASNNDSSIRLNLDSSSALLNGRSITMSAPAKIIEGQLYAPIGTLAQGLGGEATYDSAKKSVQLRIGGRNQTLTLE
jgi:predicted Zn-dependent protease